ncbi:hypothetical protein B7L09_03660 [Pseudomonas mandelii]|nr:hypothetical protein B7L09_03660 [Pseudomonas mandelii]
MPGSEVSPRGIAGTRRLDAIGWRWITDCLNTSLKISNIPVGAGLPAIADCQSTSSLNDTPLSRASPLPQGCDGACVSECVQTPL